MLALVFFGGERANSASSASVGRQMNFQERMSSTAYQRAVADMMKAGLNPMLAYSQGGASAPSGGSYQAQDTLSPAVSSGQQAAMQKAQQALLVEQTNATRADVWLKGRQADLAEAQAQNVRQESALKDFQIRFENAKSPFYEQHAAQDIVMKRQQTNQVIMSVEKLIQDIQTGASSEDENRANIQRLKALTRNLNLDSSEKEAMAKMWEQVGSGGAAAKTFVPFLQLIKSILGK